VFTLFLLAVAALSCGKGPPPVKPGTPAFFWTAALEAHRQGDSAKAVDQLAQVVSVENEFTSRARVALIVLGSGLAHGYAELGDSYEGGARMNRVNPGAFRKQAGIQRGAAARASLQAVEALHLFMEAHNDPTIPMAIAFPTGQLEKPAALAKLGKGILLAGAEAEAVHAAMLQRGVLLSACRMIGAPGDPVKAAELFKHGSMSLELFLTAAAQSMYDQSDLFGPRRLDEPRRAALLCKEALEALSMVPATREVQQLKRKIQTR
jgi:hypothetical protein